MENKTILDIAAEITAGARQEDYGDVRENFDNIAAGWEIIFKDGNFTGRRVALAMIWLKVCRDVNTEKDDNLVDLAGYARCAEMYTKSERVDVSELFDSATDWTQNVKEGDVLHAVISPVTDTGLLTSGSEYKVKWAGKKELKILNDKGQKHVFTRDRLAEFFKLPDAT